jgi:hypothetical protein
MHFQKGNTIAESRFFPRGRTGRSIQAELSAQRQTLSAARLDRSGGRIVQARQLADDQN